MKVSRLVWMFAGIAVAVATCDSRPEPNVHADRGSVAAGRDLVIGRDLVVNEFDEEEERQRERKAFAVKARRECLAYLDGVRVLASAQPKSTNDVLGTRIGAFYSLPDAERVLGAKTYTAINEQAARINGLSGDLLQVRMRLVVTQAARDGNASAEFEATKRAMEKSTSEHCDFLAMIE